MVLLQLTLSFGSILLLQPTPPFGSILLLQPTPCESFGSILLPQPTCQPFGSYLVASSHYRGCDKLQQLPTFSRPFGNGAPLGAGMTAIASWNLWQWRRFTAHRVPHVSQTVYFQIECTLSSHWIIL